MSRAKKAVLTEAGFVEKLMELDNYVHWLATVRAFKKNKNTLPMDVWTAILDRLLKFAGTPRAKEILGYEKEDQKTGTPICPKCRAEYCTDHCHSCCGDYERVVSIPGGRCCMKCKIQVFYSGFSKVHGGRNSRIHNVVGRVAYVGEKP
jgi:hypothetical protein